MIDGHCHVDPKRGNCQQAMGHLFKEAKAAGVKGIILLNLIDWGHSNDEFWQAGQLYEGFFRIFPTFHPADTKAIKELGHFKRLGASGLKLHPFRENYSVLMPQSIDLIKAAGDLGLPVLIDTFPWGKNMVLGNMPDAFVHLAQAAPQTRIAMAHSGGHRILDALMVAKNYKNIYLDLSLTLLYYRGSTVIQDLAYAVDCMRGERIFWGTDYPDREYQETVSLSKEEIKEWNLSEDYQNKLWQGNVLKFLGESQ